MNIQIIQVPYDSGHKNVRTGRGPGHLLRAGVEQMLRDEGHQVGLSLIESQAPVTTEIGTTFELNRSLAERVRCAMRSKLFPIVLAGNCDSCLGTIAGIGKSHLGVVWFDAHGDFNTPETTLSGFLDGMGLAMAAGRCWRSLLGTIPGFSPIPEAHILLVGTRALDAQEAELLGGSQVEMVAPRQGEEQNRQAIRAALDRLGEKVSRVYLHVDMDVLDSEEALASGLAVAGGLALEVVEEAIRMVKERFELCAAAMTSFDPDYDQDDKVLDAGIRILKAFVA
jgi:arginase